MVARIKVEKKQTNFTIVPNEILQSKDLSLQAKGLIAQCLSFPDNWNYSINGLVAVVKEGKTAVMNTIKELERHGYVKRNRIHDENGKFAGIEYVITDYPNLDKPHTENLNMVKTQVNQPYAGKPNMVKPNTDKPISENQPQNNTIYKKAGYEPSGRPRGLSRDRRGLQALRLGGGRARLEVRRADRRSGLGHQDQPRKAHERRVRRLRGQDAPGPHGEGGEPRRRSRHRSRDGQGRGPSRQRFRRSLQTLLRQIISRSGENGADRMRSGICR